MIEARGLSKRYGDKVAVDELSFTVQAGRVTGFLGPNGAGKTTTMRMILGLDRPTAGSVAVHGKPFAELYSPMREVGALLDATAVHGGRSAYKHLLCLRRPTTSRAAGSTRSSASSGWRTWRASGPRASRSA
jgi:ABC-2 type transport system ATP-binding protein